jgi:type VI secretion system secreted protein Hcp
VAGDCFIRLQGKIQGKFVGETQDLEFAGAIDVESWNWTGSRPPGSGLQKRGALSLSELVFRHRVDSASVHLLSALATAESCKAELTMRRAGGEAQKFLLIRLGNVLLTEVGLEFSESGKLPLESVALSFEKIEIEYVAQAASGAKGVSKVFTHELKGAA